MQPSNYVTLSLTVPKTHADIVRKAMGNAGAGKMGHYSHCSFSYKGVGRFIPNKGSQPFIGNEGVLEEVEEECLQTVCSLSALEQVLEEIKKVHPYEEMVIDIYPVYEVGIKKKENP